MSDCDNSELDEKLVELNNWQIEQRKKLKDFQAAQRKLLDSEHEKILNSLKIPNFEQRHESAEKHLSCLCDMSGVESDVETQNRSSSPHYVFNFRSDKIKLKDPKINLCNISHFSHCKDEELLNNSEDNEESETSKPKRFLKKGEGLARFRMTIDDFKSPPNIYREKRIKTYLNQKPELSKKKTSKNVKSSNEVFKKRKSSYTCNKPTTVPVNIFVADNKHKDVGFGKNFSDSKDNKLTHFPKGKNIQLSKVPMKSLTLKPLPSLKCFKNSLQEESNVGVLVEKPKQIDTSPDINVIEKQMKKDEKELKMFEMLEGKIGDGSLSPNSSLVARFMEESLCSTPSKQLMGDEEQDKCYSYMESIRALQRRYLTLEQIEKVQEFSEDCLSDETPNPNSMGNEEKISDTVTDNLTALELDTNADNYISNENHKENFVETENINENKDEEQDLSREMVKELTPLLQQSFQVNKTSLQEYIKNLSKLKREVKEYCQSDSEDIDDLVAGDKPMQVVNHQTLSQREIAIKLQRKALQDNVKNLLNWEAVPRKKNSKKSLKKVNNRKQLKTDKLNKTEKSEDKTVFDSDLWNDRLKEIEKEIETFKIENRSLTQLQKECEFEKSKLEKARKEFEKYKEQEMEKLAARISEEQKKLQRDKNVFDKYCKQMKNQPNKKEREEIANLKKEVERLSEVITTKDARLGASQARLRNQIKMLEKENAQLKSEIEKLKKQNSKKVTFENEKNVNTKIIHTINYELGKLKPFTAKKGSAKQKYQSLTARVDTNLPKKTMRRTKSVPDLKKSFDKVVLNDGDEVLSPGLLEKNILNFSHNGNEVNCLVDLPKRMSNSNPLPEKFIDLVDFNPEITQLSSSPGYEPTNNDIKEHDNKTRTTRGDSAKDLVENVLHETFFDSKDRGDHNGASETISEIKRRLENLNLLHSSDSFNRNGEGDKNECESIRNHTVNCVSAESGDSNEEDEEDEEENKDLGYSQAEYLRKNSACFNYLCQTKVDHNGIREKTYDDGRKEIIYPNGNVKKISADAKIVKMIYYNGDLKETDIAEGSEKYFYSETRTWHTTYKDGLEVLEFPNGQTERRHPDGSTEILFPNGCVRYCDSSGKDEWRFIDGTVIKTDKRGDKVLLLPNGQKEIHTKEYKRREYPDGTVKLLYADGTQETRYASGRVRLKDKEGNLVMDSGGIR